MQRRGIEEITNGHNRTLGAASRYDVLANYNEDNESNSLQIENSNEDIASAYSKRTTVTRRGMVKVS